MIQNDQDKDSCPCCSEPKPGSKPKAAEPSVKPALGGVITSSGFKFGSSNPSAAVSGFIFGSKTNSESSNSNKGQIISKCLLGVIVWTKLATKKFDNFCPGCQIKKIKALFITIMGYLM